MKFKIDEIDRQKNLEEMFSLYPLGTEVLVVADKEDIGIDLYTIDTIEKIEITDDGIYYTLEETKAKIEDRELIPYSIQNEKTLKKYYNYTRNAFWFEDDF